MWFAWFTLKKHTLNKVPVGQAPSTRYFYHVLTDDVFLLQWSIESIKKDCSAAPYHQPTSDQLTPSKLFNVHNLHAQENEKCMHVRMCII